VTPKPDDEIDLADGDYLYGLGPLRIRVVSVAAQMLRMHGCLWAEVRAVPIQSTGPGDAGAGRVGAGRRRVGLTEKTSFRRRCAGPPSAGSPTCRRVEARMLRASAIHAPAANRTGRPRG
jgi:hypothetical protein